MTNQATGTTALQRRYTIKRGDDFVGDTFNFKSPDGSVYWSGFAVKAQMRLTADTATVAHEFDLTAAAVTEVAGVGILSFALEADAADTADFDPGQYVGDIEVSSTLMPKTTLVTMRFTVLADVTRT